MPGAPRAYNTARRFNQAANIIFHECVENNGQRGGIALNTGIFKDFLCLDVYDEELLRRFNIGQGAIIN